MKVIYWDKEGPKKLAKILSAEDDRMLRRDIMRILDDVRGHGDSALRRYTRKFDRVDVHPKRLRVREGDINRAYQAIDYKLIGLLKQVIESVERFYHTRRPRSFKVRGLEGVRLGRVVQPIERVGIYIPGGTNPLVSTVYMTVLPAKAAGVKDIALCSPPSREGCIDPHILVVANLLGVKEIYRVGGAQAIAAMAFGTKTIRRVDKIVGPGNRYVTEAKRQVFGHCDVDMTAGPSEVMVVADRQTDLEWVAKDLRAQQEHPDGLGILVTTHRRDLERLSRQMNGSVIVSVKSLKEAAQVVNFISPEHVQVMIRRPESFVRRIRNAGAIFIGPYTPAVVGDYVAGPSHVLPTGGTARFFSALGVEDFLKYTSTIRYTREALARSREAIAKLTELEGLPIHRAAVEARFQDGSDETRQEETHGKE